MTQTTASAFDKRWNNIMGIWRDNRWLFVFAGWMFGLLTFPLLQLIDTDWRDLLYNLVPEAVGITFTVLILNRLADNRARLELQKRLVREAASQSNETAKAAVDWLRAEGWLMTKDSIALLKAANLRNAKLQGADLHEANLQGADFIGTTLQGAYLQRANLQAAKLDSANLQAADLDSANLEAADLVFANLEGAHLYAANLEAANLYAVSLQQANLQRANLQQANLQRANLKEAKLFEANLERANLWYANLQAANLWRANLREANINGAKFDEKTILPDAEPLRDEMGKYRGDENGKIIYDKYWTPETDMTRYTNLQA